MVVTSRERVCVRRSTVKNPQRKNAVVESSAESVTIGKICRCTILREKERERGGTDLCKRKIALLLWIVTSLLFFTRDS